MKVSKMFGSPDKDGFNSTGNTPVRGDVEVAVMRWEEWETAIKAAREEVLELGCRALKERYADDSEFLEECIRQAYKERFGE